MALNLPNLQLLAAGLPPDMQRVLGAALRAQDKLNRDISDALTALSVWTWQRPQLLNDWQDFSSTLVARYTKTAAGFVVLSGAIKSGTVGSTAFTLPVGFRPGQDLNLAPWSFGETPSKFFVGPDGSVQPLVGSNVIFFLDCAFLADG